MTARDAVRTASPFGYFGPRNDTSKSRRLSATNPRSVLRRLAKPRTSQPAPATSMIASAISITVITLSQRAVPRPPLVERVLSFISVRTSVPASRSAGANPTSAALTTSVASANSSTRVSKATASRRGSRDAPSASSARTPA